VLGRLVVYGLRFARLGWLFWACVLVLYLQLMCLWACDVVKGPDDGF